MSSETYKNRSNEHPSGDRFGGVIFDIQQYRKGEPAHTPQDNHRAIQRLQLLMTISTLIAMVEEIDRIELKEGNNEAVHEDNSEAAHAFIEGVKAARAAVYDYAGPDSPWHKDLMARIDHLLPKEKGTINVGCNCDEPGDPFPRKCPVHP